MYSSQLHSQTGYKHTPHDICLSNVKRCLNRNQVWQVESINISNAPSKMFLNFSKNVIYVAFSCALPKHFYSFACGHKMYFSVSGSLYLSLSSQACNSLYSNLYMQTFFLLFGIDCALWVVNVNVKKIKFQMHNQYNLSLVCCSPGNNQDMCHKYVINANMPYLVTFITAST